MALKEKEPQKRPLPRKASPGGGATAAEAFNGLAFIATCGGWILLLIGQRVVEAEGGAAKFFTALSLVALLAAFAQRVWAFAQTTAERKRAALTFLILNATGLVALTAYWATTESGREALGIPQPSTGQPDDAGDILTVVWIALLVVSVLPSILGELARLSMLRAKLMESRRVTAAVVAGVALSFAVTYGALFTYAAGKVDWQKDYSYFRVARPSDATARMLDSLEEPLKVLVFFPSHSEVRQKVEIYLKELQLKTNKLEFEVHDRVLVPDLAKEHKVRKDGEVVLVRGKMSQTLDVGDDPNRAATTLKKLDGEFQKVLLKAMRDKRTVYLTVGHGELNESTDRKSMRTVSMLRELVESQNYTIKNLGLSQGLGNEVPNDADIVLVLGPSDPFSEREVESLERYAEGGGSLLLALDPEAKIDLSPLAAIAGLSWQQAVVLNDSILFRVKNDDTDKKFLVAKRFSSHASVSTLSKNAARGAAVLIPGASPLDKRDDAKDFKIDFAVKSVPGSYVDLDGDYTYDKDGEKKETLNLVAAVTKSVVPGEGADDKKKGNVHEMRAWVIGDGEVFTDPVMQFAKLNQLLFLEAIRWLGGEESFTGDITDEEDVRIVHTKSEDALWFYTAILGVPSLVLGGGLMFTRRTRKRPPEKKAVKKAVEKEAPEAAPAAAPKAKSKQPEPEPEDSEPEESESDEPEPEPEESESEEPEPEADEDADDDASDGDDDDDEGKDK